MSKNLKPLIFNLIIEGDTEHALALLARLYNVAPPKIKVGLPKGRKARIAGCYTPKNQTISVLNSETLRNPYIILHEFYHHMRTNVDKKHKGTEKKANNFASNFINSCKTSTQYESQKS